MDRDDNPSMGGVPSPAFHRTEGSVPIHNLECHKFLVSIYNLGIHL